MNTFYLLQQQDRMEVTGFPLSDKELARIAKCNGTLDITIKNRWEDGDLTSLINAFVSLTTLNLEFKCPDSTTLSIYLTRSERGEGGS